MWCRQTSYTNSTKRSADGHWLKAPRPVCRKRRGGPPLTKTGVGRAQDFCPEPKQPQAEGIFGGTL